MTSTAPHHAVRSLLNGVNPGLTIQELEPIPSSRLQLQYNVKVSDGPSLLLTLPPPAVMRLLRSEEVAIESEAAVLKYLTASLRDIKGRARHEDIDRCAPVPLNGKNSNGTCGQVAGKPLQQYMPVMIKHGWVDGKMPVEYNLCRPPHGVAISNLPGLLSYQERQSVNFQIGHLLARLSTQTSPNRKFGPAAAILSVPPSAPQQRRFEGSLNFSKGATSWSTAFRSMMESILRDGEDLCVMINYGTIRRNVERFEHFLGAVKTPRLVVIDAGEDANTLVTRGGQGEQSHQKGSEDIRECVNGAKSIHRVPEDCGFSEDGSLESECIDDEHEEDDITNIKNDTGKSHIEVTGLRQWTNCIFGDPLMALPFTKNPSDELWVGFDPPSGPDTTIIEDEPNAHIRLLLYECYHAVVAVVRDFYRPQADNGKTELGARRHLSSVLRRLDELDDAGVMRRRRRLSGEVSPAKRQRHSDDESDGS